MIDWLIDLCQVITSEGNSLRLEFLSDNSVQKNGFAAIFFTDKVDFVQRWIDDRYPLFLWGKVSNLIFLHENRAIIAHKISYASSKNRTQFWYNFAVMCKSYFAQIMKKILVFVHFVISAISLFRAISLFLAISLNFEKQFQEMNESKINLIRAPFYSGPLSRAPWAVPHF